MYQLTVESVSFDLLILMLPLANAAPMLVTEISYPTYRAPLTSTYNGLWSSGAVVSAFPYI